MEVVISVEQKRGCGYRRAAKDGVGVYLVGPSTGAPCGRLPFPLHSCPTCGEGVKPSRSWTWIRPSELFSIKPHQPVVTDDEYEAEMVARGACSVGRDVCDGCPVGRAIPEGRHGLLWVGEGFYAKPEEFIAEARRMGVSRKLKAIPNGFELGKTVVYLAHRFAVLLGTDKDGKELRGPGVFSTFRPTGIDLVINDASNVPEKATKLAEKHGARIVKVVPETPPEVTPTQVSLPMVQS